MLKYTLDTSRSVLRYGHVRRAEEWSYPCMIVMHSEAVCVKYVLFFAGTLYAVTLMAPHSYSHHDL